MVLYEGESHGFWLAKKAVLQLYHVGGIHSRRQIAHAVGAGKTAVADLLRRAAAAGLTDWGAIAPLDEDTLERQIYPGAHADTGAPAARLLEDP